MGMDIIKDAEAIKPHIGYMSQKFPLYDEMTVLETCSSTPGSTKFPGRRKKPASRKSCTCRVGWTPRLDDRAASRVAGASAWRWVAPCCIGRPCLFLDEPTSGVDPVARRQFWDLIYQFASEGTTVFITTHYMDEAEHCSRVGFMYRSKLMAFDTRVPLNPPYLSGAAWDLAATPLLEAVESLSGMEGVAQRPACTGIGLTLSLTQTLGPQNAWSKHCPRKTSPSNPSKR